MLTTNGDRPLTEHLRSAIIKIVSVKLVMASETLHQLIEQAPFRKNQRLTSSEQQHRVAHLDKMIH
ncbi:MAG: hypothetical protein AB4352_04960 [Hormoscilla sp.]